VDDRSIPKTVCKETNHVYRPTLLHSPINAFALATDNSCFPVNFEMLGKGRFRGPGDFHALENSSPDERFRRIPAGVQDQKGA
jgi:hypothetical protein